LKNVTITLDPEVAHCAIVAAVERTRFRFLLREDFQAGGFEAV
jgi:hypothetical protein